MVLPPELRAEFSQPDQVLLEPTRRIVIIALERLQQQHGHLNTFGSDGRNIAYVRSDKIPDVIYKIKGPLLSYNNQGGIYATYGIDIGGYGAREDRRGIALSPLRNLPIDPDEVTEMTLEKVRGFSKEDIEFLADDLAVGTEASAEDYRTVTGTSLTQF